MPKLPSSLFLDLQHFHTRSRWRTFVQQQMVYQVSQSKKNNFFFIICTCNWAPANHGNYRYLFCLDTFLQIMHISQPQWLSRDQVNDFKHDCNMGNVHGYIQWANLTVRSTANTLLIQNWPHIKTINLQLPETKFLYIVCKC